MSTLERAIAIAAQAHAGQLDKGGAPYILHPLRVMQRQASEEAQVVGVLHDLIERGAGGWTLIFNDTTRNFYDLPGTHGAISTVGCWYLKLFGYLFNHGSTFDYTMYARNVTVLRNKWDVLLNAWGDEVGVLAAIRAELGY